MIELICIRATPDIGSERNVEVGFVWAFQYVSEFRHSSLRGIL